MRQQLPELLITSLVVVVGSLRLAAQHDLKMTIPSATIQELQIAVLVSAWIGRKSFKLSTMRS